MNGQPRRVEYRRTDRGVTPVFTTAVIEQPWERYGAVDHAVWRELFTRQREVLRGRICDAFVEARDLLGMSANAIPRFGDLNPILAAATGWTLVAVEGLMPEEAFFGLLARRRFPVTWWIRRRDQIDYISEPDLFHDLFGHVPLLMNPVFADYMQAYGRGGLKAREIGRQALANLTRLYWYTVEFGLIRTPGGLRIYGSGIASSKAESMYALESPVPSRIGFDLERIMRTRYRSDRFQQTYFIIDDFQQLFEATRPDFVPLYARLRDKPPIRIGEVCADDEVFQRGTGAGFANAVNG